MADYGKVLNTVNKCLDNPALKTSVYTNQQQTVCLRIARPANDKDRSNDRGSISVGGFKRNLGLKNGVISKDNDSYAATGRANWSDSATLDKGSSISVPVEELGKEYYLFRGKENKELRDSVKEATYY